VNRSSRIYVAGGRTLLGSALIEHLQDAGFRQLVGVPPDEPDLTVASQVEDFFGEFRPEYVFFTAGRSGGIGLNCTHPAELMLDNLLSSAHVMQSAHTNGVKKLLYLASSCSYPRETPQPMRVESLMSGPLEPTNAAYAMAKLAGWQLCSAYRQQYGARFVTAIATNSFGPNDDFSPGGHVISALIRRSHEARLANEPRLVIWGTGKPQREFLYSCDLASGCVFLMQHYEGDQPINLGGGTTLSIAETARAVAEITGYKGELSFDSNKPDGMPLKMLDSTPLLALGWRPSTDFRQALTATYQWFVQHVALPFRTDRTTGQVPSPVR
jgi:GDP-L-fucose synthase